MAVLPDYVSGTITVTQGDVNFTGTNTLWRTMGFREGDTVQLQGFTAIIKGTSEFGNPIDSNVAGQFVEPWPGQSGTFAYRMRFLPDGARFAGKSTNLIELLGNGVLANLAELGVEEGKTPVGNAAGQYELKPTSGFGIQDPTGSLGKLAALTLEENKVVTTDGSGNAQQSELTDVGRLLLKLTGGAGQFLRGDGTLSSILGTMASGALMEVGNNANGTYWRFRNGLQVTARVSGTFSISSPAGNIFVNGAASSPYALAATFTSEPYELVTGHNLSGTGHCWAASVSRPTTNQSSAVQLFRATADGGPFFFKLVHIGSWN